MDDASNIHFLSEKGCVVLPDPLFMPRQHFKNQKVEFAEFMDRLMGESEEDPDAEFQEIGEAEFEHIEI